MTNPADMFNLLDKIRYNLTELQGQVTDLKRMLAAADLPEKPAAVCADCGVKFRGPKKLAEHRYLQHDGPETDHWKEAEAKAEEAA